LQCLFFSIEDRSLPNVTLYSVVAVVVVAVVVAVVAVVVVAVVKNKLCPCFPFL
jgi:hypothetical protein